jgi:hypothetical protein
MAVLIEFFRFSATKTAGMFLPPPFSNFLDDGPTERRRAVLALVEQENEDMTNLVGRTLYRLGERLPGRVSTPGEDWYAAATAIWSKPVGRIPRAVVHCQTADDVGSAIRAARDCGLPLSVRGGGHDWAGRALWDGVVIDLSGMRSVAVAPDERATASGGARAADVAAATDPLGLAPMTGSVAAVGMAGLTLGGGYGPLIGRFGLALDNLDAAEVVLADGRAVVAKRDSEEELFWALRGGGGNFGVVTTMRLNLHRLPSVRSGMLICPFAEAKAVLEGCAEIAGSAPEELTSQVGLAGGPDGAPMVMIVPTWCGAPEEGEARLAPFFQLGTVLMSTVETTPYGTSLTVFDKFLVYGQRYLLEACCLPALDSRSVDAFIGAMETAVSPGCAVFTHEFKGAALVCRKKRPPSACVATICWWRLSRGSPTGRTTLRRSDTANGRGPRARPSTPSCSRAALRIFSPATKTRTASREATVAMRGG